MAPARMRYSPVHAGRVVSLFTTAVFGRVFCGHMPGQPYPHTDRDLLRRIERAGGRAGYKHLVHELGIGGGRERRLLVEQLTKITARGALVKLDKDTWALPSTGVERAKNDARAQSGRRGFAAGMRDRQRGSMRGREDLIAGKLSLHRDGFGFVRPTGSEGGKDDDIFIPPHDLNSAMQGDQVLVDAGPPTREGRRAGRIVRVLTRRNPTVVGIFHAAGARGRRFDPRADDPRLRGSFVVPLDTRMGSVVLIPDDSDLPTSAITPHRTLGEDALHADHQWDGSLTDLSGLAVDVEITQYASEHSPALGRVVEVLGDPDAFGVDVEIIIRKHHLPHIFPAEVLTEAQDAARWNVAALNDEERLTRRDFRDLPIVTIDGETAKDFDDAVLVKAMNDGTFELQVHIADVAEYVADGSALDLEARLRGNSVYFPDRAIPMLPQELSNGECSLRPDEDRLVLSCVARIDTDGNVLGYELFEGMIRSAQRMTYTNVQRVLNGDAEAREQFAPFVADFERMLDLAKRLNKKRVRRGSIDFDLPEPVIEFDERGAMKGVVRSERAWANRLIEEFMLCANECVARWIENARVPGMYRIHEIPDAKRILDFEEQAAGFGYTLGAGPITVQKFTTKGDKREAFRRNDRDRDRGRTAHRTARGHEVASGPADISPKLYQRLTAKIAGKPEERILSYLLLRSLKQAKYSADNEGHFALAAPSYTHFTSPIRRYPDLVVHRIVKTLLREGVDARGAAEETATQSAVNLLAHEEAFASDSETRAFAELAAGTQQAQVKRAAQRLRTLPAGDFAAPYEHGELAAIGQEASDTERRAADAERELIETKKLKFMEDRVGEDFDAIILSVTKYGFFVELSELFVEGLVPLHTLTDDRYTYRENAREICGSNSSQCYRPGMRIRVLLDRIDRENRRLQFAVVEQAPAARPSRRTNASSEAMSATDNPAKDGTRPWIPRASKKATSRDAKPAAKPKVQSASRVSSDASTPPVDPFAKFRAGAKRKPSNKARRAAAATKKNKKGKAR